MCKSDILDIHHTGGCVLIVPRENIDETQSVLFQETLRNLVRDEQHRLIIDFSNIDYIASSAWGIIVAMTELLAEKKGFLRLCSLTPDICQFLDRVQIRSHLAIMNDRETALAA